MTGLYIVRGQGGSTGKTDKPEKVQLTTTSATLYSGNKTDLEAFVTPWNLPARTIVWSSSDAKIAAVNAHGVVTAVSAGTAVITAFYLMIMYFNDNRFTPGEMAGMAVCAAVIAVLSAVLYGVYRITRRSVCRALRIQGK